MKFIMAVLVALCLFSTVQADDSVIIVLDTSGSMGDYMRSAGKTRMEVAQNALIDVLSKIPDSTKVGILGFSGWIKNIGPVDRSTITNTIRGIRPGGGTPLYEYMRAGGTSLLEERAKQLNVGSYKLLVITDGQAGDDNLNRESTWSDGTSRPGVLADIMSRNVTVDTIALDMDSDHPLKNSINGSYMKGDDPGSLVDAVAKAVAEVGFGDSQDASADAFADIADFPVEGAIIVVQGLSTFPNYPIGEKAPIPVVQDDGTIQMQPDPSNEAIPELSEGGGGMGSGTKLLVILGIVMAVIAICVIGSSMTRGY